MKIFFEKITTKTICYPLDSVEWFPAELGLFVVREPSWISVCKVNSETVILKGELSGVLQNRCGRCGSQVEDDFNTRFEYVVSSQQEERPEEQDVECAEADVNKLYLQGPEIDIDEILREQAYLESPVRMLCSENCKGVCQGCGAQLNSESCSCSADYSDSPFAILGKINKK